MAQRYAIYSDLGARRPDSRRRLSPAADALFSVQGVRPERHEPERRAVYGVSHAAPRLQPGEGGDDTVQCSDARTEHDRVVKLYKALTEA